MRSVRRPLLAAALAAVPLATVPAGAQAPVRLRLGTLAPQGTSYHRILQEMAERWRTATGGRVQATVYAGTMGSEAEVVRRMRLGQLQAAALTGVGLLQIEPALSAIQVIPMLYRSLEEAEQVRERLRPMLEQRLLDRGFVLLFWADAGWVHWFSRSPVARPDDLRRLKVFVTAGDNAHADLMRSEGFTPVSLEWADVLTSLQTGIVDAVPTIPYYALSMQLYTVARNMTAVHWAPLVGGMVMTRSAWEALSPEAREAVRAAAVAAGRQFEARGRLEADSAVGAMQRRGLAVRTLTPAEEAEWRTMAERLYPRIRGSMVPAEQFDEVMRVLSEVRARPGQPR